MTFELVHEGGMLDPRGQGPLLVLFSVLVPKTGPGSWRCSINVYARMSRSLLGDGERKGILHFKKQYLQRHRVAFFLIGKCLAYNLELSPYYYQGRLLSLGKPSKTLGMGS